MHSARSLRWGSTRNAKLLVAFTSLALSFVGSIASSVRAQSSAGIGVSAGTGADVSEPAEVPPPVDLSTSGTGAPAQRAQPEAAPPAAPPSAAEQPWDL